MALAPRGSPVRNGLPGTKPSDCGMENGPNYLGKKPSGYLEGKKLFRLGALPVDRPYVGIESTQF